MKQTSMRWHVWDNATLTSTTQLKNTHFHTYRSHCNSGKRRSFAYIEIHQNKNGTRNKWHINNNVASGGTEKPPLAYQGPTERLQNSIINSSVNTAAKSTEYPDSRHVSHRIGPFPSVHRRVSSRRQRRLAGDYHTCVSPPGRQASRGRRPWWRAGRGAGSSEPEWWCGQLVGTRSR